MSTDRTLMANRLARVLHERDRLLYWAIRAYRSSSDHGVRWGLWASLTAIGVDPDSAKADEVLARGEPRLEPQSKEE
jgi:hypothetical protein